MNTEDFVTHEQALALKKLGFSYDCDYLYLDKSQLIKYDYHNEFYNVQFYENCISAPTLAQAQKWLRESKGIYIEPNFIYTPVFEVMIKSEHYALYKRIDERYASYEEALSAGIAKCLKLLENGYF